MCATSTMNFSSIVVSSRAFSLSLFARVRLRTGLLGDWTALAAFTRDLISLRHENEIFRRASWRDGCVTRWLNPGGGDQTEEHWDDAGANTIGLWLSNPDIQKGVTQTLILFNPFEGDVDFALPARQDKRNWRVRIDTAKSGQVETDWQVAAEKIKLRSRSLVVLI